MQRFFTFVKEHPFIFVGALIVGVLFVSWIWGGKSSGGGGGGAVYNIQPDPFTIQANAQIAMANAAASSQNAAAQAAVDIAESRDGAAVTIATHNADTHLSLAGLQKEQSLELADKAITTHEMDLTQERFLSGNALKAYGWSLAGAPTPTNTGFAVSPEGLPYYMDDARTWTAAFGNQDAPAPAPAPAPTVIAAPFFPLIRQVFSLRSWRLNRDDNSQG